MKTGSRKNSKPMIVPFWQERDARLRMLTENLADSITVVDQNGVILYDSPNAQRFLGEPVGEFVGRNSLELVHPDDLPLARHLLDELLREPGKTRTAELRLRHLDGSWRCVEINGRNLLDNPEIGGIVLNTRDITERRQVEAASQESTERYCALFEQSADAIVVFDPQTLAILDFNNEACRYLGYTRAEFAKLKVSDFEVIESSAEIQRHGQRVPTKGIEVFETKHRTKGGAVLDIEIRTTAIRVGERVLIQGIWRDITARKRAEEELRTANARFRRFVDADIIGVVVGSADGAILEANDYFLRLIGYTREEFNRGEVNWRALTPPEWLHTDEQAIAEVRARGASTPHEKEYLRRDGRRVPVLLADALLPGSEERIAAFVLDITKRKQAEVALRELNATLEKRVAERTAALQESLTAQKQLEREVLRVSETERQHLGRELHDGLNQQLTAMSLLAGALQKALKVKQPAEAAKAGELAQHTLEALGMTRNLSHALYPASLESEGLSVALQELASLVEERYPIRCLVSGSGRYRLADANLERELYRIAQEAAYNAAKHSGGRHIWITLHQSKHCLTQTIKDDGIGISKSHLTNHSLGLKIIKYRANLIGAELTIDGKRGHGTTVTCKLRKPAAPSSLIRQPSVQPEPK